MITQTILVPRLSRVPAHEQTAQRALTWLVRNEIVTDVPTTCGSSGSGMAYSIGRGARGVVTNPERLPYAEPVNGLEIITRRCIYVPTKDFREEAGCPECRKEVGEPFFENLDEWMAGDTDHFECPECGFEDEVNNFLFLQPCGFSNLGFIFNGWGGTSFTEDFLDDFAGRIRLPVAVVAANI
jgi:Zn ribbon nucleic-acid-binding protein